MTPSPSLSLSPSPSATKLSTSTNALALALLLLLSCSSLAFGWTPSSSSSSSSSPSPPSSSSSPLSLASTSSSVSSTPVSRRDAFYRTAIVATTASAAAASITLLNPVVAQAASTSSTSTSSTSTATSSTATATAAASTSSSSKLLNLSNEELGEIITRDVNENQFMVHADLTRAIYDESATFTDEIDTYQLDQWIVGTQRLFVKNKSHVSLDPNSLTVSSDEATFRFTEYLTFNIPFLQPKVHLTGKVILKRNTETGLITSYQEQWDQDVNTVLMSAKLFGK